MFAKKTYRDNWYFGIALGMPSLSKTTSDYHYTVCIFEESSVEHGVMTVGGYRIKLFDNTDDDIICIEESFANNENAAKDIGDKMLEDATFGKYGCAYKKISTEKRKEGMRKKSWLEPLEEEWLLKFNITVSDDSGDYQEYGLTGVKMQWHGHLIAYFDGEGKEFTEYPDRNPMNRHDEIDAACDWVYEQISLDKEEFSEFNFKVETVIDNRYSLDRFGSLRKRKSAMNKESYFDPYNVSFDYWDIEKGKSPTFWCKDEASLIEFSGDILIDDVRDGDNWFNDDKWFSGYVSMGMGYCDIDGSSEIEWEDVGTRRFNGGTIEEFEDFICNMAEELMPYDMEQRALEMEYEYWDYVYASKKASRRKKAKHLKCADISDELYYELVRELPSSHISHWESDLYVLSTPKSDFIISRYVPDNQRAYSMFVVDGGVWYDIPFAYVPYWKNKLSKRAYNSKMHPYSK